MSAGSRSVLLERPGHAELVEGPLPSPVIAQLKELWATDFR